MTHEGLHAIELYNSTNVRLYMFYEYVYYQTTLEGAIGAEAGSLPRFDRWLDSRTEQKEKHDRNYVLFFCIKIT